MTGCGVVGREGVSHSGDEVMSTTPGRGTAPTGTTPGGGITPGCALASGVTVPGLVGAGEAAGAPGAVASHTHNGVMRSCTRALHV